MNDIYLAGLMLCGAVGAMMLVISALLVVYAYWTSEVDPGDGEWM